MKIDDAVSALKSALLPDLRAISARWPELRPEVFSHRHAGELHVFGVTCDFDALAEEFKLLVLRVAICTFGSEAIKGEVLWFRSRADFGVADGIVRTSGLDARSVRDFTSKWPSLLQSLDAAVDRRLPASAR